MMYISEVNISNCVNAFYHNEVDCTAIIKTNDLSEARFLKSLYDNKEHMHISVKAYNPMRDLFTPSVKFRNNTKFMIKEVIFNNPATIVYWKDGTKTVVKCSENDTFSEETGLALCFMKKALGNKGNYNNTFKKYIKEKKNGEE